ncbi:ABC transporter permease subunit [Pullulanibacillus sp. KACC 23026]|uniref:ABC transporter permease n=1 Tax=Pullulanibacillus sp. KACC 23026 TaxID=3028315 RepID=UPI0023B09556|nr:ABC transporter permease subunit [Pullulanibacillus sp. KACC 23026]WEG14899.1 ABC transporter permease subunit [Pullulanibacillus sp. KACC 23026]
MLQRLKRDIWMYVLIAPGVLYFLIFKYLPMWGVLIAFQDYQPFLGFLHSKWVGIANFKEFFISPDFMRLFANTLILSFLNLVLVFPIPVVVALMLNEIRVSLLKRGIQTMVYVPHFISMVVVTSMTYVFFTTGGGYINELVQNVTGHTIPFLTSVHWFRPIIIIQTVWQTTGWSTIIVLAALTGVNPELYEAAVVDGAGRWKQLWHITLPAIRSTIVILLILRLGHFLDNGFEQIYLMSNSLNRSVADVFDTYVYYIGLTNGEFSFATAVGLFKSVISIILVVGANKLAKRFGQEGIY